MIRVLAGDGPAAMAAAVTAPLLAVAQLADAGASLRAALALAAAGWTIAELGRGGAPSVAVLPAAIAGALDPGFAALLGIAGVRLVTAPARRLDPGDADRPEPSERIALPVDRADRSARVERPVRSDRSAAVARAERPARGDRSAPVAQGRRAESPARSERAPLAAAEERAERPARADRSAPVDPRLVHAAPRDRLWALCLPVAGAIALALAVLAGTIWPGLGARWFGAAAHPVAPAALGAALADALGPLAAVAALAGLAALARLRHAEIALTAAIAGALLVDLRAGVVAPVTLGIAALLAGLAITRLAAMIRLASGQAIVAAALGALLIAPPAWIALARPPVAHIGRASR